ncbi:hypothetical protein [Pontimicrobium sp. IMCC45349]|uniref:hypothetical protein n=1 Tax=Pontimicrobium sp. IMCC45349 TaxID=3391574 RepID=UPI00399F6A99
MKKLGYILNFMILASCMNSANEAEMKSIEPVFATESMDNDDFFSYTASDFNNTQLAAQKLQEYYDLSLLKQQHPEFENDIKLQLENLGELTLNLPKTARSINIDSVTELSKETLTDSTKRIVLKYTSNSDRGKTTDTISAIIKTKTITVDNQPITTTKLKFKEH